jgi:hypothetical protein
VADVRGASAALALAALVAAAMPPAQGACGPPDQPCTGPITADAGADRLVTEGFLVRLAGAQQGAAQPAFRWAQVDGLPVVDLGNASTATPSFRAPSLGGGPAVDLVFRLQVVEGNRSSRPDYVTVRVLPAGSGPVADAGGTVEAVVGERVLLNGTRSRTVDDRPIRFEWRQLPAANDIFVALEGADTAVASFIAPNATNPQGGGMHFRLRVYDDVGSSEDEAVVIVREPPPPPAPGFTFTVEPAPGGANVTFVAAAGTQNATWTFPDGSVARGPVVTRFLPPGTHEVTLRSGDAPGSATSSQAVTVAPSQVDAAPPADAWLPWAIVAAAVLAVAIVLAILIARGRRGGTA